MTYEEYNSLILEKEESICYICDKNTYELLHMTKAAMELYSLDNKEDYKNKKCYKLLQGFDSPCKFCNMVELSENKKIIWEHYNEKINKWFEVEDYLLDINGKKCRLENARNITNQKKKLANLEVRLTTEEAILKCAKVLAQNTDMNDSVNKFLQTVGDFYDADRAYIFEFDIKGKVINNTFEWSAAGVTAEIENLQNIPVEYVSNWIKKFENEGEFYITNLNDDLDCNSDDYKILEAQGINSLLAAPIIKNERIVGFLGVDDPKENSGDFALLKASADFIVEELEKRRLMLELEYASYTDVLTDLKNSNQYIKALNDYKHKEMKSFGVIFVDVNGMKTVNDNFGHRFGDKILIITATILKKYFKGYAYRIGGDEFVVLIPDIDKDIFNQKCKAMKAEFDIESNDCNVSMGAVWQNGEFDINGLIHEADELMYAEKRYYYREILENGKIFNASEKTGYINEVINEIHEGRFLVYYQPKINIKSKKVIGAEALIRRIEYDGSIISPSRFIGAYEKEGVISYVDLFVLKNACKTIKNWARDNIKLDVAVNFSRISLMEPNILNSVTAICDEYDVDYNLITVEITESISKIEYDKLKDIIEQFINAGFNVSLDDFGSEYSNLSILANFNFSEIKFDKSLVKNIENSKNSRVIMRNGVKICKELDGTRSVAEGIETRGQLMLLESFSCDLAQGYLFSKPMPIKEFNEFLKKY